MTRVILDPYSSFREKDFTAVVSEMGIEVFGEKETPKAYIKFEDGGAPITYLLDIKGKSLIEPEENGHAKIKNFAVGAFAEQVKKFGYETFIDPDSDNYEFGTIPDLVGAETTWKAEKGKERIVNDEKKEGYTNFILVGIKGVKPVSHAHQQDKATSAPKQTAPPAQKESGFDPILVTTIKNLLPNILIDPLTQQEIQKAVNETIKALPATDPQRATLLKFGAVRVPLLKHLEAGKILKMDADMKFSLA